MSAPSIAVEFRILGPFEVRAGDAVLDVGGPRQRLLLARLVVSRNHVVPVDQLIDELWLGDPPAGAREALQTQISRARKALRFPGGVLRSDRSGYILDCADGALDADRFEGLVARARLPSPGDLEGAASLLREAEQCWRGPALAEFADYSFAQAEATRLEELRLFATEERIEAELAMGRHHALAGELEALAGAHPLRERVWGQLMLCLYRGGRQAEALRAYSTLRQTLGDELGVTPSSALQALEESILLQRPDIAWKEDVPPPTYSNLPLRTTNFVGRGDELAQLHTYLDSQRVVTITGSGGVGKTRLALELADRYGTTQGQDVLLVELGTLANPASVVPTVAAALGVREEAERDLVRTLVATLRPRQLLLVLDNCEHVVTVAAALADEVVRSCPRVRVLATSREPLKITGERTWSLAALPVPDATPSLDELVSYDCVQLFADRAAAARAGFRVDAGNASDVAAICRRLDGIPLALELAAARVRALSPAEIAARLDDRFTLLTQGSRTAPPRQRTLRAAIDWSFELLPPAEAILLCSLSAFAGSFSLQAAQDVCATVELPSERILDTLIGLVEKSLVVVEDHGGTSRYRLLETVRSYGAERLASSGRSPSLLGHLLRWAVGLAEDAARLLVSKEQQRGLATFDAEYDNLRRALDAPIDTPDRLRLALAVAGYWTLRGQFAEGRHRLTARLAGDQAAPPSLVAEASLALATLMKEQGAHDEAAKLIEDSLAGFRAAGNDAGEGDALSLQAEIAFRRGDFRTARDLALDALAVRARMGDRRRIALTRLTLGHVAYMLGNYDEAETLIGEALSELEDIGSPTEIARALLRLGTVSALRRDLRTAQGHFETSLRIASEVGDMVSMTNALQSLANVAADRGDLPASQPYLEKALTVSNAIGDRWGVASILLNSGLIDLEEGKPDVGRSKLEHSLAQFSELGNKRGMATSLHGLARFALGAGDYSRARSLLADAMENSQAAGDLLTTVDALEWAARLLFVEGQDRLSVAMLALAARMRQGIGAPSSPSDGEVLTSIRASLEARLESANFAEAWADGESLTIDAALGELLRTTPPFSPARAREHAEHQAHRLARVTEGSPGQQC